MVILTAGEFRRMRTMTTTNDKTMMDHKTTKNGLGENALATMTMIADSPNEQLTTRPRPSMFIVHATKQHELAGRIFTPSLIRSHS
jgi:hypothetical protein